MTLKALQNEKSRLLRLLDGIEAQIRAHLLEAAGVKEGDIVLCKGKEFKVTHIRFVAWEGKPWLRGLMKKKSGEWGAQTRMLFDDWKKP